RVGDARRPAPAVLRRRRRHLPSDAGRVRALRDLRVDRARRGDGAVRDEPQRRAADPRTGLRARVEATMSQLTRRQFGLAAGSIVASIAGNGSCLAARPAGDGRLEARPVEHATTTLTSGAIGLGTNGRDGAIQMPSKPNGGALPLLLFLHGATQDGARMIRRVGPAADEAGVVLVCPDSRSGTWDAIRGDFGEDVVHLDR